MIRLNEYKTYSKTWGFYVILSWRFTNPEEGPQIFPVEFMRFEENQGKGCVDAVALQVMAEQQKKLQACQVVKTQMSCI